MSNHSRKVIKFDALQAVLTQLDTTNTETLDVKSQAEDKIAELGGVVFISENEDSVTLRTFAPASIAETTETLTVDGVDYQIDVATLTY